MFAKARTRRNSAERGRQAFSAALPYWDIHDNVMILKDGRLLYGFYFEPPTHINFTPDNLVRRSQRLKAVFDLTIPEGETFTTYISLRSVHQEAVADTRHYAQRSPDPVIAELTHARAALLESKIAAGEVSQWRFFATVTVTPPAELRFSMSRPPSAAELSSAVTNAQHLQESTVAQMLAAGFKSVSMSQQDVFCECFAYLAPGWPVAPGFTPQHERQVHSTRRGQPDTQTLIRQLTTAPVSNLYAQHLIVGDQFVEVLSLSRLPEYTETGYLKQVTDELNGTYYVVIQATPENAYQVSHELEKSKNDLWTRVKSPGVVPNGRAVNLLDHVEQAQKLEGLEHRFDAAVSVVLIAGDREELGAMKRRARGNLTRLRGGMPISYAFQGQAQYFALLPFGGGRSGFEFKPFSSNIIDLFPPVAPWPGFREGAITYQTRDHCLIKFDLFTPETITAHFSVFAPTGSGKTVLVQSLYNAELAKYPDAALIVTDAKQDFLYYFKSIQDAEIITFGYQSPTRLNVFDLEDGAQQPDGEKLAYLIAFVRIFAEPPLDRRDKGYEDVAITEAIMAIYMQFKVEARSPQMSDLYRMLGTIENYVDSGRLMEERVTQAARDVAIRLRKALGSSPVAEFVDCQSNITLSARRIYLSVYGVPEDDELMKRVSQHIIKNIIWSTAKNYPRGIKKFIFMDEFENQVQTEEEMDTVKRMLRVFRSFGVSFGIGTQSATASAYFGDLRDSFSHLFIGRYSKDVARDVVKVLSLPDVMEPLLPTLTNKIGDYAEFALLVQQSGAGENGQKVGDIIRVQESKLALWVFNSSGSEVAEKDRYVEAAGGNVIAGVRQLVLDKFGGVL